jgi:hypothetical protein
MEKNMKYQIYSGFCENIDPKKYANHNADDWFDIWVKNTVKYTQSIINIFGPDIPKNIKSDSNRIAIIGQYPNLGHVGDYIHGNRTGRWCGWTAGVIYGMIHAYVHGVDFLYKEQDCLAFGNYVSKMYDDCVNADIVYGSCKLMNAAQSLFLVKRHAIPDIIASLANDDDKDVLPENKFMRLPVKQKRLSFGYDRDRPFNVNDTIFYIQQLTQADMDILNNNNLL